MTQVIAEVPETTHTGDGSTTSFVIGFTRPAGTPLLVTIDDVPQVLDNDFDYVGSSVVFVTPPANGARIAWRRATPILQARAFPTQATVKPLSIEEALNERARVDQDQQAQLSRAVAAPIGEAGPSLQAQALRDGKVAWFDGSTVAGFDLPAGQVLAADPATGELVGLIPGFAVSAEVLSFPTRLAAALTTIGGSATFLRTAGWLTAGDGGGALYKKAVAEPDHAGKFQSADGAWWELAEAFATPAMFGCLGLSDDAVRLQGALEWSADHGVLRGPSGARVRLDTACAAAVSTVRFYGDPGFVLDCSGGGSLMLNPGVTALPDLSADLLRTSSTAQIAAHGLTAGRVFQVCNPTDYSFSKLRNYHRDGQMFPVAAVIGANEVSFYGVPYHTFDKDDVNLTVLNGVGGCFIEGFTIIPGPSGNPIEVDGFVVVRIKVLKGSPGTTNSPIIVFRCYDIQIEDPQGTASNGDAYPVVVSNSQKGVIRGLSAVYSTRHVLAFGGRDEQNTVPCADFEISGFVANTLVSNGIGAIDSHPNCRNVRWTGGTTDGATLSGTDIAFVNGVIRGRTLADGLCVESELNQGGLTISGALLDTSGNADGAGLIRVDVRSRNGPVLIDLTDIVCRNANNMTRGLHLLVGMAGVHDPLPEYPVEIIVDGWHQTGGGVLGYLVTIDGTNDMSAIITGSVRNVTGSVGGMLATSTNENQGIPIRFPGVPEGVTDQGDIDVVLNPRTMTRTQYFNTALTASRAVSFNTAGAVHGDTFEIVRVGGDTGGPWNLTVLGVNLAVNERCTVTYRGRAGGAGGAFVMTAKGPRV